MKGDIVETKDVVLSVAKAAVSTIPIAGGPIASLMGDFIPTEMNKRRDKLVEKLIKDFEKFKDKYDKDALTRPYFISIFLECFRSAMATEKEEKIDAYRAIILNSLIEQTPDEDESQFMIKLVDLLTPLHFKVLKIFSDPHQALEANLEAKQRMESIVSGGVSMLTGALLGEYSGDLIQVICGDLQTKKLADIPFGTMMTKEGVLAKRTSGFGDRLINYITLPE